METAVLVLAWIGGVAVWFILGAVTLGFLVRLFQSAREYLLSSDGFDVGILIVCFGPISSVFAVVGVSIYYFVKLLIWLAKGFRYEKQTGGGGAA